MQLFRILLRREVDRAASRILVGRLIERGRPERGRFLSHDVDRILARAWTNLDEMIPEADLESLPTLGNRHNVLLAALTVAAYRSFLEEGVDGEYAIELFADVGWKLYEKFIVLPRLIAKIATRDRQRRMNLMLRMLMIYPFSTPGRPGYECKVRAEPDALRTCWTHCPPYAFVKRYAEKHADPGAIEAFRKSWCWYDWAFTYAMAEGGHGWRGRYERPLTLSSGDEVCDMRWSASAGKDAGGGEPARDGVRTGIGEGPGSA